MKKMKKLLAIVLSLCMIISMCFTSVMVSAAEIDTSELFRLNDLYSKKYLEIGNRITHSDIDEAGRKYYLFDGITSNTQDCHLGTKDHPENFWIAIDLSAIFNLKVFNFISKSVNKFDVYVTDANSINENTEWQLAASVTDKTEESYIGSFGTSGVNARFVKVAVRNTKEEIGSDWIRIDEIELFADPDTVIAHAGDIPEGSVNLTADWNDSDYSEYVNAEISSWMDGKINENWQETWDQYIEVDLRTTEPTLTGFKLYSKTATVNDKTYPDSQIYSMMFYGRNSEDAAWESFAAYAKNTVDELTAVFAEPVNYRFVRFVVTRHRKDVNTADPDHHWLCIEELQLFGIPGTAIEEGPEELPADTSGLFRINDLYSSNYWYNVDKNSNRITHSGVDAPERVYNLFDGNNNNENDTALGTKEHPENFWFTIDLGAKYNLKAYNLIAYTGSLNGEYFPVKKFDIYVTDANSIDENTEWKLAANVTKKKEVSFVSSFGEEGVVARFVKVAVRNKMSELGNRDWVRFDEFELFADITDNTFMATAGEIPEESVNLTEEWTADDYAYFVEAGSAEWMNGITDDGSSKNANSQYIEIDLRTEGPTLTGFKLFSKAVTVNDVADTPVHSVLFFGRNSKDSAWEPFAVYTQNNVEELTAVFAQEVNYRFVRFTVTRSCKQANSTSNIPIYIDELQLFGIHGEEVQDEMTAADVEATGRWLTRGWGEAKIQDSITTSGNGNIYGWFNGVNGNYNDMQCTSDGAGGWTDYAIVDLIGATQLTGYILYTNPQFAINAYSFYGSNDGIDFEPILAVEGADGATQFALFEGTPTYRYVKFKVDVPNNEGHEWLNLDEVKLIGNVTDAMMAATGSWLTENWSKEKRASAVYANNSAWDFDKAFDTYIDSDNRVNFEKYQPEFVMDMGVKTDFTGYSLFGSSLYVVDYTFYGRNSENEEWEELYTVSGNSCENRSDYFKEGASYRYIKMVITNPNPTNFAHWWIEIYELKLYGNTAEGETALAGDLYGDGEVNVLDFIRMKKVVAEYKGIDGNGTVIRGKYASNFDVSDMDGNGTLDADDLVRIKKALLGITA